MTAKEILELRKQGRAEDAYQAARALYSADKSFSAVNAMFWTAVDALRHRANYGSLDEAEKIYKALERLVSQIPNIDDLKLEAMHRCCLLLREKGSKVTLSNQTHTTREVGQWGEQTAAMYLQRKGYDILERDWRSKHRDIDIIAYDGTTLVFVEVKMRSNKEFMEPESSVNYSKLSNLRKAINHFIKFHRVDSPWRFDVITIVGAMGSSNPEINHIQDFRLF